MDPSRYNLNYSMSMGLLSDQAADMYGNPAAMAALGSSRPPSGGLIQNMSGSPSLGFSGVRSAGGGGLIQCQTSNSNINNASQQRGIKRAGSDCYEDHHRGGSSGGMSSQSLQGLDSQQQQQQQSSGSGGGGNLPDVGEDSYSPIQSKKSPPANGKKTKGRVKIKMEYIDNKLRRYTTFSKRKTGIMKKAYELSTLTGTQVMLLVASETGHVYTFATRKLQPMITSEAGKQLIQTCLNSPDPPTAGGGDQRMSATGFEETELSYNIADEDSKDEERSISANDSDDSSDFEVPCTETPLTAPPAVVGDKINSKIIKEETQNSHNSHNTLNNATTTIMLKSQQQQQTIPPPLTAITNDNKDQSTSAAGASSSSSSSISNIPHEMLLQLIQSGHLQLHTEEDGSGHQYVAIPIANSTANLLKATKKSNAKEDTNKVNQNVGFEKTLRQKIAVVASSHDENGDATRTTATAKIKKEFD